MAETAPADRVRTAEIIGSLSLATDVAVGFPMEHGLQSTLVAMRLCDLLGVDQATATQTYYLCLLFYVGCTAPADIASDIFGSDHALMTHAMPSRFGSRGEIVSGFMRALAPPDEPVLKRARQLAHRAPRLLLGFPGVVAAVCELGRMLTDRLGLPTTISGMFAYESERWDGKGLPGLAEGDAIPLPVRIVHVARDATVQSMLGDRSFVVDVLNRRAGAAFDPDVARLAVLHSDVLESHESPWEAVLAAEPKPWLALEGLEIDQALAAMGEFSDIASSYTLGHSEGVASLAMGAAMQLGLAPADVRRVNRAGLVHDLGRVSVPLRVWEKSSKLATSDWEMVRLHAYHSERVLARSPLLSDLIPVAGLHHERLDGSGYHRGSGGATLDPQARLLAVADAYHAMREPRPYRPALPAAEAAASILDEARGGLLDPEAVAAVLQIAGEEAPSIERPAGLTERQVEVVRLLVRGLQTKQIARQLDISAKTADRHIQNAYRKMGVSTRAGAALFAMQRGLTSWGEFPIGERTQPS